MMVLDLDARTAGELVEAIGVFWKRAVAQGRRPSPGLLRLAEMAELSARRADSSRQEAPIFPLGLDEAHDRLMDRSEVAAALVVSARTVDRLAAEGKLARVKVGRSTRFHAADVEAFAGRAV